MNLTDFYSDDETKFKKYIREIYYNDTWLKHKKQLEDKGIGSIDSIEEGQLYLMKDNNKMYFYYYLPKKKTTNRTRLKKLGKGKPEYGFLIYIPPVKFKKVHLGLYQWPIYYEKLKMLKNYTVSVTKITNIFTQNQLINWNKLPWGDVK